MLREISHIPGPELEFAQDRESYALAAGMALGMITLGVGPYSLMTIVGGLLLIILEEIKMYITLRLFLQFLCIKF